MMVHGYDFAPGISACRPAERLILLDLGRDRYFALNDESETALSDLIADSLADSDLPIIAGLVDQGLLVQAPAGARPSLCPAVRVAQATLALSPAPKSRRQSGLATIAVIGARRTLRRKGLAAAIGDLRCRRPAADSSATQALHDIVAGFRGARGVISPLDQCLPRSLALARRLFRAGLLADFIIGVAVQPFRAHCWVQYDDQLLIDDVDTVRQFTPILLL